MTTLLLQFGKTFASSMRHFSSCNKQLFDRISFDSDDFTETLNFGDKLPQGVPNERSINDVNLLGRVGNNPALITGMNYRNYARFLLATRSLRANKERGTDWHEIVCYEEKLMDYILNYIKPGDRIFLQGTINYVRPPPELNVPYNRARIIVRQMLIARRKDPKDEDPDS